MMTIWDSVSGAQLKIGVMNNGLSVSIWLPLVSPDGTRKYPSERRYSTVISPKNAIVLEKAIMERILPEYEKGNNIHVGVFTNNASSNMIEIEARDGVLYLLMHRNCDAVTRIPKETINFKFDTAAMIEQYDYTSGQMEVSPIQADFFVFVKALSAYNTLAGGYYASHGSAMASAVMNQRFMDYIRAIAEATKAQLPAPNYQQNGGYRPNNNYGTYPTQNVNNVAGAANLPAINPTEVTTLSELVG